jgi:hypothetical protein
MFRDEILSQVEKQNQRLLYIVLALFLVVSAVSFVISGRIDANPFKLRTEIPSILQLKLSSNDLATLLDSEYRPRWATVRLVRKNQQPTRVKIRLIETLELSFKVDIDGTVYNLYRIEKDWTELNSQFYNAYHWGLESTTPQLVQLKLNNVLIGIYIMERHVYDQIRAPNGDYFVRLGSDIRLLNKIHYQVRQRKTRLLEKYFDTKKMAAYFVFFSLFCYDEVLDFHRLVFRYDAQGKVFVPYLTMESVIMSLKEQGKEFKVHLEEEDPLFKDLTQKTIRSLYRRSHLYKYEALIKTVLTGAPGMTGD